MKGRKKVNKGNESENLRGDKGRETRIREGYWREVMKGRKRVNRDSEWKWRLS